MKKSMKHTLVIAAAAMSLLACTKEIQQPVQPAGEDGSEGMYTYQFVLDGETKTALDGNHLAWEAGDRLGAYVRAGEDVSVNQASEVDVTATPVKVGIHSTVAMKAGAELCAYFPYVSQNGGTPENVTLTIPTAQVQAGTAFDSDAMPLASVPVTATKDLGEETELALRMVGLGSLVCFNLYSTDGAIATEKVTRVTFAADKAVAGDFTYDLTSVSYDETEEVLNVPVPDGFEDTEVSTAVSGNLAVGSSKTAGAKVYMVLAPVSAGGTIRVYTDNATRSYKLTVPEISFSRNATRTFNIDLANAQIVSTENGIWSADDLLAASAALNAGESVSKYLMDGKLTLMADLNMKNLDWESFENLTVSFNGNGHSLKNWTTSAPLFVEVASDVTVSDLTIDETCAYTIEKKESANDAAWIAALNNGTLSGIVTNAAMTTASGLTFTHSRATGAIAAVNAGTITGCANTGSITLNPTAASVASQYDASTHVDGSMQYIGGIAGKLISGAGITDCSNSGAIRYSATGKIDSFSAVGGIVGGTPWQVSADWSSSAVGTLTRCTNGGTVTLAYETMSGVSGKSYNTPFVGGVAGFIEGTLTDCANNGAVTLQTPQAEWDNTGNSLFIRSLYLGGVAGIVTLGASGCTNNAPIVQRGTMAGGATFGAAQPCLGGVIGFAGNNSTDASARFSDCHNLSLGTIDSQYHMRGGNGTTGTLGGVFGYDTAELNDCTNSAALSVCSSLCTISIGGVSGTHKPFLTAIPVSSCSNSGDIDIDLGYDGSSVTTACVGKQSTTTYIGGVIGWSTGTTGNVGTLALAGNSGDIRIKGGLGTGAQNIGGLVGLDNAYIDLQGTSSDYLVNSGDIDVNLTAATSRVGGIIGYKTTADFEYLRNEGSITIQASDFLQAGGIAGYTKGGTIQNVSNTGAITVRDCNYMYTGGILGLNETTELTVSDVENSGRIDLSNSGTDESEIGGIVGKTSKVLLLSDATNKAKLTYTKQTVGGNYSDNIGGIIGIGIAGSTVSRAYNEGDIEVSFARGSVAGIAAWAKGITVSTAWNKGTITVSGKTSAGTRAGIGGIVGTADSPVSSADNYGSISANGNGTSFMPKLGGIAGEMSQKSGSQSWLIENCENKSGVTLSTDSNQAYVGGILGSMDDYTKVDGKAVVAPNGTDYIKSSNNNGKLISVTSTGTAYVGGIAGEMNTGDIRNCVNNCPLVAHIGGNACVGGVRGNCTGAGRTHVSSNTGKVEAYVGGTSYARLAGIAAQTNGQLHTCTNSGELYLESSAPKSYIGGVGSQNGANGATSASNAPISFKYTGSAASPEIYAAYGIAYQSGATPTYYGTYGGRLTIDTGSATSPVVYCGALIGRLSGSSTKATFGNATHPVQIVSSSSLNGRSPSSDSTSDDYYAGISFLVGTVDSSATATVSNVQLL